MRWARILAAAAPLAGLMLVAAGALAPLWAQVERVDVGPGRVGAVRATARPSHTLQTSRDVVDLVPGDIESTDVMRMTDLTRNDLGKEVAPPTWRS